MIHSSNINTQLPRRPRQDEAVASGKGDMYRNHNLFRTLVDLFV